jgi:hypothetical protein
MAGATERLARLIFGPKPSTDRAQRWTEILLFLHREPLLERRNIALLLGGAVTVDTISRDFKALGQLGLIVDPNWRGENRQEAWVALAPKGRAELYGALRVSQRDRHAFDRARHERRRRRRQRCRVTELERRRTPRRPVPPSTPLPPPTSNGPIKRQRKGPRPAWWPADG